MPPVVKACVIPTDVADAEQCEAAAGEVERTFGPIDVWVNVAFTSVFSPFWEITPAEFRRVTEVSYLGYVCTPQIGAQAVVQQHCHQHAILGYSDDRQLLVDAGVDIDVLDAGCCSLAGNFGFENGHCDVSVACAEDKLMPAVRDADPDTLILADGFSCRTQIRELATDRKPMHLAQVIAAALSAHEGDTRATQIVDE